MIKLRAGRRRGRDGGIARRTRIWLARHEVELVDQHVADEVWLHSKAWQQPSKSHEMYCHGRREAAVLVGGFGPVADSDHLSIETIDAAAISVDDFGDGLLGQQLSSSRSADSIWFGLGHGNEIRQRDVVVQLVKATLARMPTYNASGSHPIMLDKKS